MARIINKNQNVIFGLKRLGLHGFEEKEERSKSKRKRRKRRKKKEEEKKIKVWNPYIWVFDMNPKVF